MAMTLDTAIKFTTKFEGQGLDQLKRNLQGLSQQSNVSKRSLDQLYSATQKLGAASGNTIAGLQKTVSSLRLLRDQAEFGSRSFKMLTRDIEAGEAKLRRFQSAASSSGGISRGGAFVAGLAGGLASSIPGYAMQAVQSAAQVGLDAETAQVRLKALTDQFGEYNAAQAATARIAQTLRISNTEAQDSFSKLYAALRPTGVTLKEVEDAYIGFSAAARASGATAVEASAALEQLKQALGSGVLQGDELRSIREQAPAVGQAIAKEMGVTVGELKKFGEEGKITTDIVLRALARLKGEKLDQLNDQFNTGTQALKDLSNAAERVGVVFSKIFGPVVLATIKDIADNLNHLADAVGVLTGDSGATQRVADRTKQQTWTDLLPFPFGTNAKQIEALIGQLQNPQTNANPGVTAGQQQAVDAAAKEREAARERTAMDAAKKRLAAELKIREETETKLASFREESIRRAAAMERDLGDQRLQLERNTAEARRRIAAQEQDFQLERERLKLRANGLSTDQVDLQQRLNEATRRFTEQKIQIEQNATDRKVQLERTLSDYQLSVARGISEILQDAGNKLAQKMIAGGQGAAAAMAGGTVTAPGGIIARTGNTGQTTGPHLDARWADGRPITAADADRYLMVNGRSPSSYGVTSGYGRRNMFGRSFHAGMDFGTPSGSGISLQGGASLLRDLGFTGAGGYAVEIMTPQGPMRLLHLQGGSAARPGAVSGVSTPGLPGLTAAGSRLDSAIGANRSANTTAALGDLLASRQSELGSITSELDGQRKASADQLRDYERMMELQRSGISPELAKQRVDAENAARAESNKLQTLRDQLIKDREIAGLTDQQKMALDGMLTSIDQRIAKQPAVIAGLTAEQQKLEQLQQAYEQKKQLVEGIANSIGGGIGQALDLVINGTDNWGKGLQEIAAGVLKDIARQLLQIMVIQPIVKGITSAFGFADGGIMTSSGPVPLRAYAGGGIASSPQLAMFGEGSMPEAYVPLPDGRRIPVAMKGGGGGTTVNVSVDATGSSVQGDAGRGEQLGRAISQAVQAELIKQRRPGGLLTA